MHLRPHAPVAERVLLPGDPGRALRLAQELISGPKMLNHHRGLWGYCGPAKADGHALTVQATGFGGPSAAAVVDDLVALGARRLVRVGTCATTRGAARVGDFLIPATVLGADGTSRALGASGALPVDGTLAAALGDALAHARSGTLVSVDVAGGELLDADAIDHSTAAVLAAAARHDLPAAAVLVVAAAADERLGDEPLHAAELEAGRAALAALAAVSAASAA